MPIIGFYHRDAIEYSLIQRGKTGSWNATALRREVFLGVPGNIVGIVEFSSTSPTAIFFLAHFSPDEPIPHFRNLSIEQTATLATTIASLPILITHQSMERDELSNLIQKLKDSDMAALALRVLQKSRASSFVILPNSGLIALNHQSIIGTLGNRPLALALAEASGYKSAANTL